MTSARRIRHLATSILVVGTLGLVVAGNTPVSAASDDGGQGPVAEVRPAPAKQGSYVLVGDAPPAAPDELMLADLRHHAETQGLDFDRLVARQTQVVPLGEVLADLEGRFGDEVARAGVPAQSDDEVLPWIQFKNEPSNEALAVVRSKLSEVTIDYGAPASYNELNELSERLIANVNDSNPDISATTAYDSERREVAVVYSPVEGMSAEEVKRVIDDAIVTTAHDYEQDQLPLPVASRATDKAGDNYEATVEGGRNLNTAGVVGSDGSCTGGFTATRNGDRGILTAEHCFDNLWYGTVAGIITTNPAVPTLATIDAQYHRTITGNGHVTNAQFRATGFDASDDRITQSYASPALNQTVCHWGRSSYYACGEVIDTDDCRTLGDGNYRCGLTTTSPNTSDGGDSGGPWFLTSTAYGLHTSGSNSGDTSTFTKIGRILSALDATLVLG